MARAVLRDPAARDVLVSPGAIVRVMVAIPIGLVKVRDTAYT